MTYSDPYGLKVCFAKDRRDELVKVAEQAINSTITLDDAGCVDRVDARKGEGYEELREKFQQMVSDDATFRVQFANGNEISNFNPANRTATINPLDSRRKRYISGSPLACALVGGSGTAVFSSKAIFVHELIGHGSGMVGGGRPSSTGVWAENLYHAAVGERRRCGEQN